ncbi:MAG: hypothetical protein ABSB39_03070 [Candidatus Sulfotelmatobacter sp.]
MWEQKMSMWGQKMSMWGQPPSAVQSSEARQLPAPIYETRPSRDLNPMTKTPPIPPSTLDQSWVLNSLEHDQLARAKKHPIPRRHLKGPELLVLWALRLYLLSSLHDGRRHLSSLARRTLNLHLNESGWARLQSCRHLGFWVAQPFSAAIES